MAKPSKCATELSLLMNGRVSVIPELKKKLDEAIKKEDKENLYLANELIMNLGIRYNSKVEVIDGWGRTKEYIFVGFKEYPGQELVEYMNENLYYDLREINKDGTARKTKSSAYHPVFKASDDFDIYPKV